MAYIATKHDINNDRNIIFVFFFFGPFKKITRHDENASL